MVLSQLLGGADTELMALAVLLTMIFFTVYSRPYQHSRTRLFLATCILAGLSVVINILTLGAEAIHAQLPRVLVAGINTAYFIFSPLAELVACGYVLAEVYAGVEDRRGLRYDCAVLCLLYAGFLIINFTNGQHGWLFTLDETNHYARGSASWLNLALAAAGVLVCMFAHLRHRQEEDRALRTAMRVLPIVAMVLALLQFAVERLQMAGAAMALTLLVLFICCQRQQVCSDSLTGAGSRDAFIRELERLHAHGAPCLLQMVSLQGFKQINRRYGQLTGDHLLQALSAYLKLLYKEDRIYRLSGVEFVVLHPHVTTPVSTTRFLALQERFRRHGGWTVSWPSCGRCSFPMKRPPSWMGRMR